MLQEEFSSGLQSMCHSLGFERVAIPEINSLVGSNSFADLSPVGSGRDAVIVLSCRVRYNPHWSGFCGHPQMRSRMQADNDNESCPASFLAPYLQLYKSAQKRIYLTETSKEQRLITLPKDFLANDEAGQGSRLVIALDKVAEPDEQGAIVPVFTSESKLSFNLSAKFLQELDSQGFDWRPGRNVPIGRYLGSDMFSFTGVDQAVDRNNPFYSTLFAHLHWIVPHQTPHLRAAEIHLRQEFDRAVNLLSVKSHDICPKVLCLAGLEIDMAPLAAEHEESYFVPWKAYMEGVDEAGSLSCSLGQDELFVRLRQ